MARVTAAQKAAKKRRQRRIALSLAAVLALVVLTTLIAVVPGFEQQLSNLLGINKRVVVPGGDTAGPTAIHFIGVGQGDAVLVEQDGEYALIDAGPPEGEETLLAYLDALGVQTLRYLMMSHPHADHIGGMRAVVEKYEIEQVILPDFTLAPYPTTKTFESLLASMVEHELAARTAAAGDVYALGSGSFTVLQAGIETRNNLNHLSTMLLFEAQDIRFLTTGDAEKENEAALLESGASFYADVYKAGHHGSSTSSTQDFVARVNPALVVVCCGEANSYGHPHREPLEIFEQVNAAVLRTDQLGHIVVRVAEDGSLTYSTEKEAA